ncbi:hypothetical protein [uncultured Porticoccus sp.]|uniref:hypothetical protein n=1 Tax=uncultured Porticoccus sp. TaxID=1256050 RepID=UPI0030DC614F|tara:strand:- start:8228 stop:8611 length:384 start_codon:yes stop_codon:yes gene_type:complete
MTEKKQNPLAGGLYQDQGSVNSSKAVGSNLTAGKPLGKGDRMLCLFASGVRLHRFKAEPLGDHCLPTTIADLQQRHGLLFDRVTVKVRNRFGGETRVTEYWLSGDYLKRAQEIARTLQGQKQGKEAA